MRRITFIVLLSTLLNASTMWVRIYYSNDYEKKTLFSKNYDILTGNTEKGYFEYFLDEGIVDDLQKAGFTVEILHPDIVDYLEQTYGHMRMTFGYHYTYSEMVQELNQIAASYPNITHKVSIGQSWEGRDIWAMKISDNANQNEGEPSVLVTGVHHAREPIGCGISMDFINWLVENYGTNDSATTIVNTDEVWVVPVVNPDGYVFNETYNDPWGYGWRKNRRDNGGGVYGVDLNRNYGYMWGYDNQGSSPDPSDDDYRGPAPFSEPETQVMRVLCDSFGFLYAINYHSFGNYLIFPWGYIDQETPDSLLYRVMADSMTSIIGVPNNYVWGTASQTVGYPANGVSDDWMYGEQTEKPKCFAFSPEVGESFWQGAADTNIIIEHCNETRPMNIYLCLRAVEVGIEEVELKTTFNLFIFPNPASNKFAITFHLEKKTRIVMNLYDSSGRIVMKTDEISYPVGQNKIKVDVKDIASGIYFVYVLDGNRKISQEKIVILRN